MATYLELVRRTIEESGGDWQQGQAIETLEAPAAGVEDTLSGWERQVAAAVRNAWSLIQSQHNEWTFRRRGFEARLRAGQVEYPADTLQKPGGGPSIGALGVAAWWPLEPGGVWYLSDTSNPPLTGISIPRLDWDTFRRDYLVRRSTRRGDRPQAWAADPEGLLHIAPAPGPERLVDIEGDYVMGIQRLEGSSDVPVGAPEALHEVIVWRATMMMLGSDTASQEYQFAQVNYEEFLDGLGTSKLGTYPLASPLA